MSEAIILTTKLQEERDYWVARLSGEMESSNLSLDFQRSKIHSKRKETLAVEFSDELTRKLVALTGGSPFLLYTCLMVALKVCLHKQTGSRTIVVGSPAYRDPALERQQEVNVLAIMDELSDQQSFRELLSKVRQTLSEAYKRQSYPFDYLVKDLGLEGAGNRSPLFDIVLALEEIHMATPELKNDINITFAREAEKISGSIAYDARLFTRATIERFARHLENTLSEAVANLNAPVHTFNIWTEEERRQLLSWNETQRDYPRDTCVHQLFEAQAASTPDRVALIGDNRQMTYRELNARANQLAHHLHKLGIGADNLVGIFGERSMEIMVAILGILKAGGACLPLDISYPKERLAFMLEDARVPVLLTQQRQVAALPAHTARTIVLEALGDASELESRENPVSSVTAENLLYVLYTSGSTGRPKGVAMPHRPLSNLITWQLNDSTAPGKARTLQYTSLNFDVSFQEIFTTLCAGGTLVLVQEQTRKDPVALWRHMSEQEVERLFLPFIALQHLAEAAEGAINLPAKLKEVITAGEQLRITPAIVALFRRLNGCSLHNHYGPTESHVVSAFSMENSPSRWPTLPPIGKPVANTQIYLLDQRGHPVPAGVPGELHIGGDALALGYLNRPELTAEKFIPHPLASAPGERLYRTGDLARYLPDGNIEFLGRLDHQVKIRGARIELGEIEAVLGQHEGVKESVVVAREDVPGDKRLVAYVVNNGKQPCSAHDLRRFLAEKLTEHMIPSAFVMLEALPLTPSGKVNRRALPAPDTARPELAEAFTAPQTAAEEVVADIWTEVLGVEKVGVNDNFFELGGHSLLGTQLISKLGRAFQVELPLRHLFRSPTVKGLINELAQVWGSREVVEEIARTFKEIESLTAAEIEETLYGQNGVAHASSLSASNKV